MVEDFLRRPLRIYSRFIIFQYFLKWYVRNFADDSTIYSCAISVNDVTENLQSDLKIALNWFKDNQMMANPG